MIIATVKAFFDALAKGFSCVEAKVQRQCETDVLKSKKKAEKKNGKQEDLILDMAKLLERYKHCMTKPDRIRATVYISRIKGVN